MYTYIYIYINKQLCISIYIYIYTYTHIRYWVRTNKKNSPQTSPQTILSVAALSTHPTVDIFTLKPSCRPIERNLVAQGFGVSTLYPLVNIQKAIENGQRHSGFSH